MLLLKRFQIVQVSTWQHQIFAKLKILKDDWFDANTLGCYKFLDSKVNISWVEAQLECEKVGGFLAEPMEGKYDLVVEKSLS